MSPKQLRKRTDEEVVMNRKICPMCDCVTIDAHKGICTCMACGWKWSFAKTEKKQISRCECGAITTTEENGRRTHTHFCGVCGKKR